MLAALKHRDTVTTRSVATNPSVARYGAAGLKSGRPLTFASRAMVVAPSGWAAQAGIAVLRDGGSAVDAAIAIGAALVVAQPHQCGLGGDAFWLIREREGATAALNASGRAAAGTDADALREAGHTVVPPRSGAAVTVPGLVSGWSAAHARHGRLELARLLAPAIRGADDGLAVSGLFAHQLALSAAVLAERPESARVLLPGGRAPRTGEVLRQPDLAATLRLLAQDPSRLYSGELAERIAAAVGEAGGWISPDDLAAHRSDWTEPLRASFAGWEIEEMPPNSQGVAALVGLRLLESSELPANDDASAWAHRGVEAARALLAVRDAEVADPEAMRRTAAELIGDEYLEPLRRLSAMGNLTRAALDELLGAAPAGHQVGRGDTVHYSVVDEAGLAVSCIQSVFDDFGSGIVVPGTGILMHNRGRGFTLQTGHANTLSPGRRPMHTLAPGMATAGGRTAAVFGAMGGHAQAQIHVQLIAALAGRGEDPGTAVQAARWYVPPEDTAQDVVEVEERDGLPERLEARGHHVRRVGPYAQQMGHAQVIVVDYDSGVLVGAADPRSDGIALGD